MAIRKDLTKAHLKGIVFWALHKAWSVGAWGTSNGKELPELGCSKGKIPLPSLR